MADYYSLLSRAIANLPKSSPPTARKAIYDRARKALNNQLRSLKPPLPESDILREETALEEAAQRIEAGFDPGLAGSTQAVSAIASPPAASKAPPPVRPPAPTRPAIPRPAPPSAPAKVVAPPAPAAAPPPLPVAAASESAATTFAPPVAAPARPTLIRAEAKIAAPRVEAQTTPAVATSAPTIAAPLQKHEEPSDAAPLLKPTAPLAVARESEPSRPVAPRAEERGRARAWTWAAFAFVVGLMSAVAVAAFLLRSQKPQDLAIPAPKEAAAPAEPTSAGAKIVERIGGAEAPSVTPTQSASPPLPQDTAAPTLSPTQAVAASTPEPTPAPTAPPAAAPAMPPNASRAAFLVATPQDVQKPTVSLGSVVWSSPPANPGQGGGPGVRADVEIPELKLRATMLLRKNVDPSLPASHTIDLRLAFDEGAPFKGVKDVGVPQMRREDGPAPTQLLGVRVVINDGYFLIGLNRNDADIQRNLDAISSSGWFDFPMLLPDGRIAKLTFEKGSEGDKIVASAIAAWK